MMKTIFHKKGAVLVSTIVLLVAVHAAPARPDTRNLPQAARLVLSKAGPLMEKKQYARAEALLAKFIKRGGPAPAAGKPDLLGYHHPEVYFALGNCRLLQNRFAPAAEAYTMAVTRDPGHTFAWLNLAKAHYELKQYEKAARDFLKAYESASEKNPEHLYFCAAAYLMAGKNRPAADVFERLFHRHPRAVKPEYKEYYVHALLADNRPKKALPTIRDLADHYTGKKKIQWQEILLHQYLQLEMRSRALELARQLTRQQPGEPRWWKALAHIYLEADRPEQALSAMMIYSFLTPLSLEEKRLTADLCLLTGIPVKAVPLYEACLREQPDERLTRRLVQALRQLGRPEKALAALEQIKPHGRDTELLMLKGDLLYSLKRYHEAARLFLDAAKVKGKHRGRAWLMAGYAAWRMDDAAAAKKALARASKYGSEKKAALQALDQLRRTVAPSPKQKQAE